MEKILKALANKRRLAISRYLKSREEAPVGDIAKEIGLSFRSTSRHLAILRAADILEKEQRSLSVFYRLSKDLKPIARYIIKLL